jgi:replicative DNA helicase
MSGQVVGEGIGAPDPEATTGAPRAQIPPVGRHVSADTLLVGGLLWATPAGVAAVLVLVRDDDIESLSLSTVLRSLRGLAKAGKPHGPQLVLDALQCAGQLRAHNGVADALQAAVTSGADPSAAWDYAAAVVARSLRRRIESAGVALQSTARESAEAELAPRVAALASAIGDCAQRLETLRGDLP